MNNRAHFQRILLPAFLVGIGLCGRPTAAGGLSESDPIFTRLVRPMNSIVDGQPLRDAIESIANQARLNIWLDRRVDPTTPVSLGPLGPTVFVALEQLASSRQCVLMPVANVVLIGRAAWVDQTAAAIVSLQLTDSVAAVEIVWEDLTTPGDALGRAVGAKVDIDPDLPHDLWPAVHWREIDRRVAVALILAQFDRRPASTGSLSKLTTDPASSAGQFTREYGLGKSNRDFRRSFLQADRAGRVDSVGELLSATGIISAHRIAMRSALASTQGESHDIEQSTFSIKRMRTSAANAFEYFAKLSGRVCRIDADVAEQCKRIISITGTDLTLRQLTDQVAKEVDVAASWTVDTIVISRATDPRP